MNNCAPAKDHDKFLYGGPFKVSIPHLNHYVSFALSMASAFAQMTEGKYANGRWPGNFSMRFDPPAVLLSADLATKSFLITRSDVDKTALIDEDFMLVATDLVYQRIKYWGKDFFRPSIETAVHRLLLEKLDWVKFIIHGHAHLVGGFVAERWANYWPEGDEGLAREIIEYAPRIESQLWATNVKNHGFFALIADNHLADSLDAIVAAIQSV